MSRFRSDGNTHGSSRGGLLVTTYGRTTTDSYHCGELMPFCIMKIDAPAIGDIFYIGRNRGTVSEPNSSSG